MSSEKDEQYSHHSPIPKKRYKVWKDDADVPVPIKTLQRWAKNAENPGESGPNCNRLREESDDNTYENSSCDDNELSDSTTNNDDSDGRFVIDLNDEASHSTPVSENETDESSDIYEDDDNDNLRVTSAVHQLSNDLLYDNSEITVTKSVLTLMDLYLQYKLTKAALNAILKMLQLLLPKPNKMPTTQFRLFQFIENAAPTCSIIKHYYCKECLFYNGTNSIMEVCKSCSSTKGTSHFYELDIQDQIKHMFENRNLGSKLRVAAHEDNLISDITDGSEYIRVNSRNGRNEYDLTLILNTDGISLVKSSKSHCWPLMFMIAELPEHLRESYIIVTGLWYDTARKPLMNTFFQPFCKKLSKYFYKGISWINPMTNQVCTSKIVAPLIIADAPARAQIQNIVNFNGKFGCNICETKTRRSEKIEGKRRIRVYAFHNEASKLRTGERMQVQGEKALKDKKEHVKGVKGKSIVSLLPFLDLGTCVVPEYMHSGLLGVGRQFINLWVNMKGNWSMKKYIPEIDNFLMNIKPPHFFNRMPRSITLSSLYKASEYLNLILYYSIPAFVDYLPDIYFQHWLLFVISLFNLLQKPIRVLELEQTEILLRLFVRDVEKLYSDRQYTYNVHQLLHFVECVKRWGPLFATSAFPFENYNGFIANCVHGSKHFGQEIINNVKLAQGVQVLKSKCDEELNHSHQANNTNQLLGKATAVKNPHEVEIMLIEASGLCFKNLNFYARAKINNEIYTSQIYKIVKTNSYTVQIDTNRSSIMYGSIRFFFKLADDLCFILQDIC